VQMCTNRMMPRGGSQRLYLSVFWFSAFLRPCADTAAVTGALKARACRGYCSWRSARQRWQAGRSRQYTYGSSGNPLPT
jgi:hypothetical protein